MSKELEQVLKAYNQVEEFISEMPLSYKGYNTLGASEYISDRLNEIEEALNEYVELKQAITPPTEEEVCKALSEYYKKNIQYEDGCFYYQSMITKPIQYITIRRTLAFSERIVYDIEMQLPPYLITLIGRFYEGESK